MFHLLVEDLRLLSSATVGTSRVRRRRQSSPATAHASNFPRKDALGNCARTSSAPKLFLHVDNVRRRPCAYGDAASLRSQHLSQYRRTSGGRSGRGRSYPALNPLRIARSACTDWSTFFWLVESGCGEGRAGINVT